MEPTEQERQMLECIREQGRHDRFRLTIELEEGVWQASMEAGGFVQVRGVGASFDQAWDNMAQIGR
jgi:hypothetical protein